MIATLQAPKKRGASSPPAWRMVPLSEVVDILDSKRVPVNSSERAKRSGIVPYYGATGQVGYIDSHLFDEELILLGEDGAPFLDPGKPKAYLIKGKSWVNNHAHVLRGKAGLLNSFLLYQLNNIDYRPYVSGTTRLKLPQGPMKQIPLLVPSPDEQRQIVAEIEKQFTRLEAGVTALKRVQANLKRYRAAVLKAACEGKLVPTEAELAKAEGRSYENGEHLLQRIFTERRKNWSGRGKYKEPISPHQCVSGYEPDEIPEGWNWASVAQIGEATTGFTPPKGNSNFFGGEVPFIKPTDLDAGYYVREYRDSLTEAGAEHGRILQPRSILVTCIGATIGKTGFARVRCATNQQINALTVRAEFISSEFAFWFFCSPFGQCQIIENASATTLPILNKSKFEALHFPLPPLAEQKRIVEEVERRFSVIDELETVVKSNLQRATRLRQSILQKAFAGELA